MEWAKSKGAWLKAVLGCAISGWAVYLCCTRFDWVEVWSLVSGVPALVLVSAVGCYLSGFALRAWRASLMLEGMCKPAMVSSLAIVAVGYAGNNLLPFRMGELLRADATAKVYGVRRGAAIVQVGAERIFDAMAIVALLLAGLSFVRIGGAGAASITSLAKLASVGFVIGVMGFVLLIRYGVAVRRALVGRGRVAEWVSDRLVDTLSGLRDGRRLAGVVVASVAVWILEAGSFSVLAAYWGMEDCLVVGWVVMGVVNLSVLLPSAPGHIGVYHWAVVLALGALSVTGAEAMSFSVVIHALQWVSITTIGLLFMLLVFNGSRRDQSVSE